MRLIDADALLYDVRSHCESYFADDFAREWVDKQPTVDAVPVIRCKDCKYYVIHTLFGQSQGWCERLCDEFDRSLARATEPDDYCSRAERKEK